MPCDARVIVISYNAYRFIVTPSESIMH